MVQWYSCVSISDACILSGKLSLSSNAKLPEPVAFGGFEMHIGHHLAIPRNGVKFSNVPGMWVHGHTPITIGLLHQVPGTGEFIATFRLYVPQQYTGHSVDSLASIPLRARIAIQREVIQSRDSDPENASSLVTLRREVVLAVNVSTDTVVASPLTAPWEFPPSMESDAVVATQVPGVWPEHMRERSNTLSYFEILE